MPDDWRDSPFARRELAADPHTFDNLPSADGWKRLGERAMFAPVTTTVELENGGPVARVTFDVVDGTLQCRQVSLSAVDDDREIRSGDLRSIDLAALGERVAEEWSLPLTVHSDGYELIFSAGSEDARAARQNLARTRRRLNDQLLRQVAKVYAGHDGNAPTRAVAEAVDVDRRTARRYVRVARDKGFLPPLPEED